MELLRDLRTGGARKRGCIVTIGTFDGLHLGHRALMERTLQLAAAQTRPSMMLTFEPMPREHLSPSAPPARLTNFRERFRLVQRAGLDALCVLRFDESLRGLSGEAFASLVAQALQPAAVVVGHDFHFGRGGAATTGLLKAAGAQKGFTVHVVDPVCVGGERVSSTAVREVLARGDLAKARALLGRAYTMRGRVIRGEQLGRKLGFPTANLRVRRRRSPLMGIFAVRVRGAMPAQALPGVASLGTRPTVAGVEPWLETHLFDFAGDLYGREIEVEFVAKLRDEARFDSLEALVAQMERDAGEARAALARMPGD